jgi:hypothetical protein
MSPSMFMLLYAQTIPNNNIVDKSAASLWRQFRDKLSLAKGEIQRWLELQNALYVSLGTLLRDVSTKYQAIQSKLKSFKQTQIDSQLSETNAAGEEDFAGMSPLEVSEMLRGLKLVRTLAKNKFAQTDSNINQSRNGIIQLDSMSGSIIEYINAVMTIIHQQTQSLETEVCILLKYFWFQCL